MFMINTSEDLLNCNIWQFAVLMQPLLHALHLDRICKDNGFQYPLLLEWFTVGISLSYIFDSCVKIVEASLLTYMEKSP